MNHLSRKKSASAAFLATALFAGLGLAGCAGQDEPDESSSAPASSSEASVQSPEGDGTTSYPLEIDSDFGVTTLKEWPERIAVISPSTVDSDALVALGITPVFAPDTVQNVPWMPDEVLSDVETFWTAKAGELPSPEQVAAVEPDLIVALQAPQTFAQKDFDAYSAVAPVLMSSPAGTPLSWEEIVEDIAGAVDLESEAEELASDVHARVEEIAQRNPDFEGKTVAHVHVYSQEYGAAYFSYAGGDDAALLQDLGFEIPANAEKFVGQTTISDELIGDIDADVLLLTVNPTGEGAGWFTEKPLFQTVPAVQEGRFAVYEPAADETFAAFAWAVRMPSPLSVPWAAESLEQLAQEAMAE